MCLLRKKCFSWTTSTLLEVLRDYLHWSFVPMTFSWCSVYQSSLGVIGSEDRVFSLKGNFIFDESVQRYKCQLWRSDILVNVLFKHHWVFSSPRGQVYPSILKLPSFVLVGVVVCWFEKYKIRIKYLNFKSVREKKITRIEKLATITVIIFFLLL